MTPQDRYLAHQSRKRKVLEEIIAERHSERMFSDTALLHEDIDAILGDMERTPSSCDRRGVFTKTVNDRDSKAILSGLLVGGVGWIHRAPVIILLMARKSCYIAGDEVNYMPFLDAGVMVQQCYISSASLGIKCCFCNPNIREFNRQHFDALFSGGEDLVFCGALAIGNPR